MNCPKCLEKGNVVEMADTYNSEFKIDIFICPVCGNMEEGE